MMIVEWRRQRASRTLKTTDCRGRFCKYGVRHQGVQRTGRIIDLYALSSL